MNEFIFDEGERRGFENKEGSCSGDVSLIDVDRVGNSDGKSGSATDAETSSLAELAALV